MGAASAWPAGGATFELVRSPVSANAEARVSGREATATDSSANCSNFLVRYSQAAQFRCEPSERAGWPCATSDESHTVLHLALR